MACLHRKIGLCTNEFESIFDGIKRPTTHSLTIAKVWFSIYTCSMLRMLAVSS